MPQTVIVVFTDKRLIEHAELTCGPVWGQFGGTKPLDCIFVDKKRQPCIGKPKCQWEVAVVWDLAQCMRLTELGLLIGKRIKQVLGAGGIAVVYQHGNSVHNIQPQRVAIKTTLSEEVQNYIAWETYTHSDPPFGQYRHLVEQVQQSKSKTAMRKSGSSQRKKSKPRRNSS